MGQILTLWNPQGFIGESALAGLDATPTRWQVWRWNQRIHGIGGVGSYTAYKVSSDNWRHGSTIRHMGIARRRRWRQRRTDGDFGINTGTLMASAPARGWSQRRQRPFPTTEKHKEE